MTPSTADLYREFVLGNYAHFGIELARGEGCRVWDSLGREYLDFCSGIAVCTLGHCHPRIVNAIREQAGRLIHISNLYLNRNQALAAERLAAAAGSPGRVFFCNSGAEANEFTYKIARRFAHATRPPGQFAERTPEILTFTNSFHGRTLGGIAATAQPKVKEGFEPAIPGFRHLPFNDVGALTSSVSEETVAVLVEPVQGDGGIHPATPEFLRALENLCRTHNLLLMLDEIQCGLGRCGAMRAWEAVGAPDLQPDVVAWAKGVGGGFPVGAVWVGNRPVETHDGAPVKMLPELLGPGSHGTTYGGSPLAAAVIIAVLDAIEELQLCANAAQRGAEAMEAIRALKSPFIREVRGKGLMIGIALDMEMVEQTVGAAAGGMSPAAVVCRRLNEQGLLTPPAGPGVVRWLPPLTVSSKEIQEAAEKLGIVLGELESGSRTPATS